MIFLQIFIMTIVTLLIAFLMNPLSKKAARKIQHEKYLRVHVHHSAYGVILFILGVVIGNVFLLSVGLGLYLAHGAEEIHFNKKRFPKAFFIFVTR